MLIFNGLLSNRVPANAISLSQNESDAPALAFDDDDDDKGGKDGRGGGIHRKPDRLIARFVSGVGAARRDQVLGRCGAAFDSDIPQLDMVFTDVIPRNIDASISCLDRADEVKYVEPNNFAEGTYTPSDSLYDANQYGPQLIGAESAWELTQGDPSVLIAIIDSGVDYAHPDLAGKVILGTDFVQDDADPADAHGHGTHVAGIAAASTDNNEGIAGIGYDSGLLAIRVLDEQNVGSYGDIAAGIVEAADLGARVINLSLGGSAFSSALEDAVDYAWSKNALVIAAAGNDGVEAASYPAAYANAIAVVATDFGDNRWPSSNYGEFVDISAPGSTIYSTDWTGEGGQPYTYRTGTSMASPHVSGVAALLLACNSALTNTELRQILESTSVDLGDAGRDNKFGVGRVDAAAAVTTACTAPPTETPTETPTPVPPTETPTPVPPTETPVTGVEVTHYLVSTEDDGSVDGLDYANEDILRFDPILGRWTIHVDGSDILPATANVDAYTVLEDGTLLFSFSAPTSISGVGTVDDSDLVRFSASALGEETSGIFELYFDGSDVGLDSGSEDIDAVATDSNGDLLVSLLGRATVSGINVADEDILRFIPTALGSSTSGSWSLYLDGSDVGLGGNSGEDVWGVHSNETDTELYLSTRGNYNVDGVSGSGGEIVQCDVGSTGSNSSCEFSLELADENTGFTFDTYDAVGLEAVVVPATEYQYLPTADTSSGKTLALAGERMASLAEPVINLYIAVPNIESDVEIGIFDGDSGGVDGIDEAHWDFLGAASDIRYTLFADPNKDGSGTEIGSWLGNGNGMPDNDWFTITLPQDASANAGDGFHVYRLKAELVNPDTTTISNFTVRALGNITLEKGVPFSFEVPLRDFPDADIIYPDWPALTNSTYDGTWSFALLVEPDTNGDLTEVVIWDGDLDHGSFDSSALDSDDPDTPADDDGNPGTQYPSFAVAGSNNPEGAAGQGSPTDDSSIDFNRRSPSIRYEVVAPDGTVWANENPSGSQEWERFTIRTTAHADGCTVGVNADHCVSDLEPGIYELRLNGVDLFNLNAFYLDYEILGSQDTSSALVRDASVHGNADEVRMTDELYLPLMRR